MLSSVRPASHLYMHARTWIQVVKIFRPEENRRREIETDKQKQVGVQETAY